MPGEPRRGAAKVADVPSDVLAKLNLGEIETVTLAETLATDFGALMKSVFHTPDWGPLGLDASSGVTVRMARAGALLEAHLTPAELTEASTHPNDVVRGWAAYANAQRASNLGEALQAMRPFAGDHHFGVREWAWLCVRPTIASEPKAAIDTLTSWARVADPNIRRFAAEATRPRGVWAKHIRLLKLDPSQGRPILDQLCVDVDDYVLRSVGNWLRDAAKTSPEAVDHMLREWEEEHGANARIQRIRRRSLGANVGSE